MAVADRRMNIDELRIVERERDQGSFQVIARIKVAALQTNQQNIGKRCSPQCELRPRDHATPPLKGQPPQAAAAAARLSGAGAMTAGDDALRRLRVSTA